MIFGFGQSLVLSRLKHTISQKQKEGKVVLVFGGHSLAFSLSSRKQRDDDDESTERNVPVLSLRPSSLSRGEEKGKRSDYVGKIQKCETFARWENHDNKLALLRYNAVVAHPLHLSIVIETIESDAQKTKMCTKRTMFNKFIPMVTSRSHR